MGKAFPSLLGPHLLTGQRAAYDPVYGDTLNPSQQAQARPKHDLWEKTIGSCKGWGPRAPLTHLFLWSTHVPGVPGTFSVLFTGGWSAEILAPLPSLGEPETEVFTRYLGTGSQP